MLRYHHLHHHLHHLHHHLHHHLYHGADEFINMMVWYTRFQYGYQMDLLTRADI